MNQDIASMFNLPQKKKHNMGFAGSLFGEKKAALPSVPLKFQSVEHHEFDTEIFEDLKEQSEMIEDLINEGKELLPGFEYLAGDIFLSLFKANPYLRDSHELYQTAKINKKLMSKVMESDEYQQLRAKTQYDVFSSAIGCQVMQETIVKLLQKQEQKKQQGGSGTPQNKCENGQCGSCPSCQGQGSLQEQLQNILEQEEFQEMLRQKLENMDPDGNGKPDNSNNMQQFLELQQAMEMAAQQAQAAQESVDDELNEITDNIVNAIPKIMEKVEEEVGELSEYVKSWGFQTSNDYSRIPYQTKRAALDRIRQSGKLKKFTDLVGKMKNIAIEDQKKKSKDGAVGIKSVKTGNDIQHVLQSEKMKVVSEVTKKDFVRRYYQKELLQHELESVERKGRGPMIVCVDVSGSVNETQERWSKAFTLALLEIAQLQKRNFACILFDSEVKKVYEVMSGNFDPNTALDIAEFYTGGGTDFSKPLNASMDIMKKSTFKNGDIVFITDGDCSVSPEFLKKFKLQKEEQEFSVRSILVNVGGYNVSRTTLDTFSDEVMLLSSFDEESVKTARNVFQAI